MDWPTAKKIGIVVLGLGLPLGGFWAGRASVPTKIVEKERVVTKEVRVEVESQKLLEENRLLRESNEELKKKVKIVKVEVKTPDGGSTTTTTTEIDEEKKKHETEVKTEIKIVEVEKKVFVDRIVEKEAVKMTEAYKPQWDVDLLAGVKASRAPTVFFGGSIQHRILWGIFAGGWGLYAPSTGEFMGGLSVGGQL
jgi:hypothetical protein